MTGMWLVLKTIRKSNREKLSEALTFWQVYESGSKKFVQTLFKNSLYRTVNIHITHYKDQSVSVIDGHNQLFIVRTVEYVRDFRLPPRCKLDLRSYGILRRNSTWNIKTARTTFIIHTDLNKLRELNANFLRLKADGTK